MSSILILAATDKPEDREQDALQLQLADAEIVAKRISESVTGDVTLLLPTVGDSKAISKASHPTLSSLLCQTTIHDLRMFDALVVIPPHEDSMGPLHPVVAKTLNHFLGNEKRFALCSGTTGALRWMLPPDTPGLYKSTHIPDDEKLCQHLYDHLI